MSIVSALTMLSLSAQYASTLPAWQSQAHLTQRRECILCATYSPVS